MGLSIERQARFIAGLIVLICTILGVMVDLRWHLVSAVVGVGLMFSALTDICALGLLLAKAPWNREPAGPKSDDAAGS